MSTKLIYYQNILIYIHNIHYTYIQECIYAYTYVYTHIHMCADTYIYDYGIHVYVLCIYMYGFES